MGHMRRLAFAALLTTAAVVGGAVPATADSTDLDPTWGAGGVTTFDLGFDSDTVIGVHPRSDGRTLFVGVTEGTNRFGAVAKLSFVRLTAWGALDPTYG